MRANRGVHVISIVLPAKNEAAALQGLLPRLREARPGDEIIVVDDGSSDETAAIAAAAGARVLSSPYSMGNGAAIKRGARAARGEVIVFMDADGQHDPALIERLLERLEQGYDMVVGARDWSGQAGVVTPRPALPRMASPTLLSSSPPAQCRYAAWSLTTRRSPGRTSGCNESISTSRAGSMANTTRKRECSVSGGSIGLPSTIVANSVADLTTTGVTTP